MNGRADGVGSIGGMMLQGKTEVLGG